MAHYAEIDSSNKVLRVLVVDNLVQNGADYLANTLGLGGVWVQTSYNTHGGIHYGPDGQPDGEQQLGYNYAGIGYNYDPVANAFYINQPFPSWSLNPTSYLWEAPIPYPTTGGAYYWDEQSQSWLPIQTPSQ